MFSEIVKDSIINGDNFKSLASDYIDQTKPSIDLSKKPKIIFLFTDWVGLFIKKILPKIDYPFKLITHNADHQIDDRYKELLENKNLIKWYGMNCHIEHPKLQPIPIGIANEKWAHGNKNELLEIVNSDINHSKLCYSNFEISTNPTKRSNIFNIVKDKNFIDKETQKLSFKKYLTKLKSYKYVISPPGNSIDCHRIWESLYLGVIPVVEKHLALKYFEDLPILFVDSFNDITEEMLKDQNLYNKLKNKSNQKLFFDYYKQLIL